jgi:hypothetical protein
LLATGWLPATAQSTISGQVRTAQQEPIPGALVELQNAHDTQTSTVVTTDESGQFTLRVEWPADSLVLSVRALGFTEQVRRLPNRSQAVSLTLPTSTTQLKEVIVKSDPIRRQGDTLSYNVGSFTDAKDQVIADVLRKMPGIEIEADGRILYEGKPIQKFYINGVDLLEGRYNLASNNMPAGAVRDVQVLENHQPIRALDNLVRSDRASLNLQLKKDVTLTGQARLGAGAAPALWNANLSPMLFTKKQQFIDTYQTNNTGQDVLAELKPLGLEELRQLSQSSNQKPTLTGIQGLNLPPIAGSRYLFNQAHLLSANHLLTVSKETQLRVNASYLHDTQRQEGGSQTFYYLPDETVVLTEAKRNRLRFNNLQTDLALIKNGKKQHLKNTLSLQGTWDSQAGDVYRGAEQVPITQQAINPFYAVTNRLGIVRPAGGQKLVQVASVIFYTNSPQRLAVSPGPFAEALHGGTAYDTARQRVQLTTFYTDNSVSLITSRGRWGYTGALGFSQEIQRLTSALEIDPDLFPTADTLRRNSLNWRQGKLYAQPTISYKAPNWNASLEMPVSFWNFAIRDAPLAAMQNLRTLTAEPRLNGRYDLSPLRYVSASTGLSNRFGTIEQLNYAYLLRDYRTLQRNDAPLARSLAWNSNIGLYYKNPLKSLFYHATYGLTVVSNNRLARTTVQDNGVLTTVAVDQDNQVVSHSFAANVSQFLSAIKTTVTLQGSARLNRQQQILNSVLAEARNRSLSGSFKASLAPFEWSSLEYNATITALRNEVESSPALPVAVLQEHHASLALYPGNNHQLLLYTDYYNSQGPGPTVRTVFSDIVYRYTRTQGRKIDFEVKWSNVFNTNQYQFSFADQFILVQNNYLLRPSQVLFSVRLSL